MQACEQHENLDLEEDVPLSLSILKPQHESLLTYHTLTHNEHDLL